MTFADKGRAADSIFVAGGEMGNLMRSLDWSQTPLGDVTYWPQSLRSAVSILLPSKAQICLFWGTELIALYNDAYRPALASKHPWGLGRPARELWSEVWDALKPLLDGVVTSGEAFWARDHLFFLNRYGYSEETYFDVSYDPVRDESGEVGGVFCIVSETTGRVLGDRRLQTLSLLASKTAQAKTVEAACRTAIQALATNAHDIPFALLYRVAADGKQATLVETAGFEAETSATPAIVDLTQDNDGWGLRRIHQTGQAVIVDVGTRFGALPKGTWDKSPAAAWVVPVTQSGQPQIVGFLVLGINPHRAFENEYREFFDLVAGNVTNAIANARAFEEERQRVEALAELDRAKTSFFNNISHEFRTPLTLMLSPLEQTLAELEGNIPTKARSQLELVQRNGKRLLKLVNTLLDFSRIEAGRTQANYQPTDLATYTAELASLFRSTVEQAGLQLTVDCPPLPEPIYVDRDMWEKIVLNLLSNAFKFTFEGEIAVVLRPVGDHVELMVRDTGTGIPAAELPKLFERFHRVEGARGRTFEGTGIGLSLVQELVDLQGGAIAVDSTLGRGSTFTVRLPMGTAHLPSDDIHASRAQASTAFGAIPYVEEALGWLPEENAAPRLQTAENAQRTSDAPISTATARILLVDDNADMRDYLHRLLSQFYQVEMAKDGETALTAVYNRVPDLILSDVMMPGMDGFELLRRLRADAKTREIPFLLLSARAGEESAIEGLEAGADDYLVKPFSTRELLARVAANIELGRSRQAASQQRFRFLAESIPQMVWTADASGWVDYYSPGWFDYTGLTLEQIQGSGWQNTLHPDDRLRTIEAWTQSTEMGTNYDIEHRLRRADGIYCWHLTRALPMRDENGQVIRWFGTCTDITERKQAEEALRESEELKQSILESSTDCIKVLALNGEILYINPGGLCLLEIDEPKSILYRVWADLWESEDYEKAQAAIAAAKIGNISQFQGYRPTTKGTPKWWDIIITPVRDAKGQVVQLLAISRDITEAKRIEAERQQAELALREAHVQLESALAAGAVYTWRWSIPGDRVRVNAAFARLFAVDPVSATSEGLPIEFFINSMHEEDRPRVSVAIEQAIHTGEEYAAEYRVRTVSGEERWLTARGRVEYDAAGKPVSFPGALVDITERKQAEVALRQSEERYRTLFESIDEGFCLIEMQFDANNKPIDYRFLETNPAFGKQTGLEQAAGKTARQLIPNLEKHWYEIYGKVALTGESIRFENGSQVMNRWFDVYAFRVGQPESRKVAVLFKDISDRKRSEIEREQILQREQAAREAAEQANRIKDEFLAVLSHELRSPLNPILGWSQLLQNRKMDQVRTTYALQIIERNAKLQVQLIDDLLDVSRILQGKLSLNVDPVNLATTITAALETVQLAAAAKSIQIQTILEPEVGQVLGDSGRLQQVIWNLLSNAVKFTPSGGRVEIRLKQIEAEAQITVSDTGKGILPQFLPYVFEYFRQADSATTRQFGGLGLGLAIVRQIVELHGGSVRADSAGEGQGATFTVKFPLMSQHSTIPQIVRESKPLSGLQGIKVLVVDDTTDMREYVAFVLEQEGAEVVAVGSAAEALATLAQFQPAVLVSDIGMPEMDGYMLLRQVRRLPAEQGGEIPAIALTAYVGELNQQQAIAAGFQRHLSKPIESAALIAAIVDLIKNAN
ncbi:ATP-binding protein [Trichocoleus sp. ST-U1]